LTIPGRLPTTDEASGMGSSDIGWKQVRNKQPRIEEDGTLLNRTVRSH
jgi:hypothetical protein